MRAKETKLNKLLSEVDLKFTVPIYQRKYSWSDKECLILWNDILKLSKAGADAGHFIGSIVCYQQNDEQLPGEIKEQVIIDGQQRLTTLSLLMLAIARGYENLGEEGLRISKTIKKQFIFNDDFQDDDKYKLVHTYEDRDTYIAIANNREKEEKNISKNMLENFEYFLELINNNEDILKKIYVGVNKLDLVYIVLSKSQDNPQLIFESMNSTGKKLSQGDLLRNYLLLDVKGADQTSLYEDYWKPIEQSFGQIGYVEKFDYFIRDFLTMKEGKTNRLDIGYEAFKEFHSQSELSKEDILKDLKIYSKYYTRIFRVNDPDPELNVLWKEFKTIRVDVANPFLIKIYYDYENAVESGFDFSKEDFIEVIKTVISYVIRRYICDIPTNSLNKTFASLYNHVSKDNYKESIIANLILLNSYKVFPNNEDFKKNFSTKDMYNLRLKNYIFEKLENNNHLNGIVIDGTDISIEHVLPQSPNLKKCWIDALGENYVNLHKEYVNTIGNLTITKGSYNSQMSNYCFNDKKLIDGGINYSHYRISSDIANADVWNIPKIKDRSEKLANEALSIWKFPDISEEKLNKYKIDIKPAYAEYDDLSHFGNINNNTIEMFNKLEKFTFEIDQTVKKVISKTYISYKYDYNNFMEIIFHKTYLTILLDIPHEYLDDELNLFQNVENIGRWGTGTSRIRVSNLENYDYIINAIKQSYEYIKNDN